MNEHVDYQAKKPNGGTKFLWWCAGADAEILKYSSYSDHVKYVGIGGVVLATGFMAALSMGFAMHTIFRNWPVTISIAIAWGLIVFNLDRFIVSSTGKGDGEYSISVKELLNALPRLLMAVLLGLTISAPLETQIFSKEIDREWNEAKDKMVRKSKQDVDQKIFNEKEDLSKMLNKKTDEISKQEALVATNKERVDRERKSGTGPQWQKSNKELDIEIGNLERMRSELKTLQDKEIKLASKRDSLEKIEQSKIDTLTSGFLDQIMMLEQLSSEGKYVVKMDPVTRKPAILKDGKPDKETIYGSAAWPIWLVRILFMIIEIAPVILKLMLIKGPSDYMSENVNQILETKQGISIYHMKDEEGKVTKLKRNHNPERIIAIIEHQNQKEAENAKEAITVFAEKEKEQIKNNPDDFIKPTT